MGNFSAPRSGSRNSLCRANSPKRLWVSRGPTTRAPRSLPARQDSPPVGLCTTRADQCPQRAQCVRVCVGNSVWTDVARQGGSIALVKPGLSRPTDALASWPGATSALRPTVGEPKWSAQGSIESLLSNRQPSIEPALDGPCRRRMRQVSGMQRDPHHRLAALEPPPHPLEQH